MIRKCPNCHIDIVYKTKAGFVNGCRKQTWCSRCCLIFRSFVKNIEKVPFNKRACDFIDKLNYKTGWEIKHALNGGEFKIDRLQYWLDGYDRKRRIIFEYDEPWHYDETGVLLKKDQERQVRIINLLKPRFFIRYDEQRNRLYEVITGKEVWDYGIKKTLNFF